MMPGEGQGTQAGIPPHGMPAAATVDWVPMPRGGTLETLAAPLEDAAARDGSLPDDLVALASAWVAEAAPRGEPAVTIPLYGTFVAWAGARRRP